MPRERFESSYSWDNAPSICEAGQQSHININIYIWQLLNRIVIQVSEFHLIIIIFFYT